SRRVPDQAENVRLQPRQRIERSPHRQNGRDPKTLAVGTGWRKVERHKVNRLSSSELALDCGAHAFKCSAAVSAASVGGVSPPGVEAQLNGHGSWHRDGAGTRRRDVKCVSPALNVAASKGGSGPHIGPLVKR